MSEDENVLLNAPLVPDPDAGRELGSTEVQSIADKDIEGCRLLLTRRGVKRIDLDGRPGGAVEFGCAFQPADGARFVFAMLKLKLEDPAGLTFLDVAPESVSDKAISFKVESKGKLSVSKVIDVGVEQNAQREYAVYFCVAQATGAGSSLARWTFRENPVRKDGLGTSQALGLTIPAVGLVKGTVTVAARIARPGLRGAADWVRDLILGPSAGESRHHVAFEIPETPDRSVFGTFLLLGG